MIAQSRHSDIDVCTLPLAYVRNNSRSISIGDLAHLQIYGLPLPMFIHAFYRGKILDDVTELFRRLGFGPKPTLSQIRYKNDGYWSCIWTIRFGKKDTNELVRRRIIIQLRKVAAATRASIH